MSPSEMLTFTGLISILVAAAVVTYSAFRTNTTRVWKDEAEAWKARAETALVELEELRDQLTELEGYTQTLVRILSTIDPQRLDDLRSRRL